MTRQITIISAVLMSIAVCGVYGYKEKGVPIQPEFSAKIAAKLNVLLSECISKRVEFNPAETSEKVTSCLQQMNDFGSRENEYPDITYPEDWENAEQLQTFRAARKLESSLRVKYFCEQVSSGLQCLSPLNAIFDQCQSSEGIALFGFGEEMCKNDGQPIVDMSDALEPCGKSRNFISTFETCGFGEEGNGLEKYIGGNVDIYKLLDEICNVLTLTRECIQQGFDAEPEACAQASQVFKDFAKGAYGRVSNAEAAAQCIR